MNNNINNKNYEKKTDLPIHLNLLDKNAKNKKYRAIRNFMFRDNNNQNKYITLQRSLYLDAFDGCEERLKSFFKEKIDKVLEEWLEKTKDTFNHLKNNNCLEKEIINRLNKIKNIYKKS